ncbi:HAD family hydrolase [Treponema sp. HNW]|uniref:HAD family hydrolase n=1 Tax=Treponema sp. HNW TaxID=3116654 RepID=UPI003D0F85E2
MYNEDYTSEPKENKPIIAICYDFDKTLSPDDMQAQGYIQSINYEIEDFWAESNKLAADNEMDQNLAYMYLMSKKSRGKFVFTKEKLKEYGSKVKLFPGVNTWFDRINAYGTAKNVIIEHYIISSGLKEMIEGTEVADKFKKIYASAFYFDDDNVAVWPAQAVNYTNKTQFLFRIEKGVLDVNDQKVNAHFKPDQYRVPFRNMIYIGDSDTDIPCMKLVNINGGHSIGVYNADTQDKSKVFRMLDENRIKYFAPADYTENSELEILIKRIIDRTVSNEIIENIHFKCRAEKIGETKNISQEEQDKESLIDNLEDSMSFFNTHSVIAQLSKIDTWTIEQKTKLVKTALNNRQVTYILRDKDVKEFYEHICKDFNTDEAESVKKILNS